MINKGRYGLSGQLEGIGDFVHYTLTLKIDGDRIKPKKVEFAEAFSIKRVTGVLFAVSFAINLLLGIMLYDDKHDSQSIIEELCGMMTLSSIHDSSRLNAAIENNDRQLALIAGNELMQLLGLLKSSVALELGVQNTYGPGSLSSLAELIIWGDDKMDVSSIGSPDDSDPFFAREIEMMRQISVALEHCALALYPEGATVNTYMHEERAYQCLRSKLCVNQSQK